MHTQARINNQPQSTVVGINGVSGDCQSKNGITSEVLQNKIVDNLKADVYFDGNEIQIKLQKAIAILPEKQQLVFKMKYYEEIKYEELSEILGTSVGALKASYHHAVKKIEDFVKNN